MTQVVNLRHFFQIKTSWRIYELHKGKHLLIDCVDVPYEICINDKLVMNALSKAVVRAGATILSTSRHHLGHNSPPGFALVICLDESHCSAHSYAEEGKIAMDVFTCGNTNPEDVLKFVLEEIDLGTVKLTKVERF